MLYCSPQDCSIIHCCCPLCHVASGDVAPVFGVKREQGRGGGYGAHLNLVRCSYTSRIVVVVGPLSVAVSPFFVAPAFRVRK